MTKNSTSISKNLLSCLLLLLPIVGCLCAFMVSFQAGTIWMAFLCQRLAINSLRNPLEAAKKPRASQKNPKRISKDVGVIKLLKTISESPKSLHSHGRIPKNEFPKNLQRIFQNISRMPLSLSPSFTFILMNWFVCLFVFQWFVSGWFCAFMAKVEMASHLLRTVNKSNSFKSPRKPVWKHLNETTTSLKINVKIHRAGSRETTESDANPQHPKESQTFVQNGDSSSQLSSELESQLESWFVDVLFWRKHLFAAISLLKKLPTVDQPSFPFSSSFFPPLLFLSSPCENLKDISLILLPPPPPPFSFSGQEHFKLHLAEAFRWILRDPAEMRFFSGTKVRLQVHFWKGFFRMLVGFSFSSVSFLSFFLLCLSFLFSSPAGGGVSGYAAAAGAISWLLLIFISTRWLFLFISFISHSLTFCFCWDTQRKREKERKEERKRGREEETEECLPHALIYLISCPPPPPSPTPPLPPSPPSPPPSCAAASLPHMSLNWKVNSGYSAPFVHLQSRRLLSLFVSS